MNFIKTAIDGVVIVEPRIFKDDRGYFFESYNERIFKVGRDGALCSEYFIVIRRSAISVFVQSSFLVVLYIFQAFETFIGTFQWAGGG